MGDRVLERLGLRKLHVDMVGHPVAGMHGVHYDVRFENGSGTGRLDLDVTDVEIFKEFMLL